MLIPLKPWQWVALEQINTKLANYYNGNPKTKMINKIMMIHRNYFLKKIMDNDGVHTPKAFLLVFFLTLSLCSSAQTFKLMRFDEDYSNLKDSTRTFYNRLKYMPLSQSGSTWLSLGGEIREELDYALNEDWGRFDVGRNIFSLQRYSLHADLHMGERIRVFGQLRSGLEFGRKNGPRKIDEDELNVQNLFVDLVPYKDLKRTLTVRLGRQELQYGSGRIIDVRDGPNLRLYFDGAKVAYASSKLNVDAFVMAEAKLKTGAFDNTSDRQVNLWGIYGTLKTSDLGNFDLYYLGTDRPNIIFEEATANDKRHTVGARHSKDGDGLIYNAEAGYQFGKFGTSKVSAFGISSEIGYRFRNVKGKPTVKFRNDYISGDKANADGRTGTFGALYPNGGYFGMVPQAGPVNLISAHPSLAWRPVENISVSLEVVLNWRESLQDGIYRPEGSLNVPSSGSTERYIGTSYITSMTWDINRHFFFLTGLQYFETGKFLNDAIPGHKDGVFAASVLRFKF